MSLELEQAVRDAFREFYVRRPVGTLDYDGQGEDVLRFARRLGEGSLTIDENPYSHLCVYFAAYDPEIGEVFIGHHRKSNHWLFNGGHIEKDETPQKAAIREMTEEWGFVITAGINSPALLTVTDIESQSERKCTLHYDIWFFVPVRKANFSPDNSLLEEEFYQTGWKTIDEARELVRDSNTRKAIDQIEALSSN